MTYLRPVVILDIARLLKLTEPRCKAYRNTATQISAREPREHDLMQVEVKWNLNIEVNIKLSNGGGIFPFVLRGNVPRQVLSERLLCQLRSDVNTTLG